MAFPRRRRGPCLAYPGKYIMEEIHLNFVPLHFFLVRENAKSPSHSDDNWRSTPTPTQTRFKLLPSSRYKSCDGCIRGLGPNFYLAFEKFTAAFCVSGPTYKLRNDDTDAPRGRQNEKETAPLASYPPPPPKSSFK